MPIIVRIRPVDSRLMNLSCVSTALMEGPHLLHVCVSVIKSQTRVADVLITLAKATVIEMIPDSVEFNGAMSA